MTRPLELHIDEIVLEGVPVACERELELALELELSRSTAQGTLQVDDCVTLDAGSFGLDVNAEPRAIAASLAQLLCASMLR